jgi:hypothetical protein
MTSRLRYAVRHALAVATPSQWLARLVVLVSPFVVVLAAASTGARLRPWLVLLVAVCAVGSALRPDTHAVGGTLLVLVVFWWWSGPASSGLPVLVAALGVVALHAAGTLAAHAPPTTALDPDLVLRWALRGGALWLVALVAWLAGRMAVTDALSAALGLVVVAGVCAWAVLRYRTPGAAREDA